MGRINRWRAGRLVIGLLLLAGCAGPTSTPPRRVLGDDTVTVGSFNFPESVLLAELYASVLESRDIEVRRALAIGPRELVMPSLQRGLLELVPEYSGSALGFLGGSVSPDPTMTADRLRAALSARGLVALDPARAQNQNGFVLTTSTATELGVRTLSELREHAASLRFGGPQECPRRPLCLAGLQRTYGLRFADVVPLDAGGPLTLQALRNGLVDIALLFSSDGALDEPGLVLLADDRSLQPPEQIVPVVHAATVDRFGQRLVEALDGVSTRLTTRDLRAMNAAVASGRTPEDVAREWLRDQGLLPTG